MIWIILYIICTATCCGIILYINDVSFCDNDVPLVTFASLVWPVLLLISILYGLGHCVRLLLNKIIKTK